MHKMITSQNRKGPDPLFFGTKNYDQNSSNFINSNMSAGETNRSLYNKPFSLYNNNGIFPHISDDDLTKEQEFNAVCEIFDLAVSVFTYVSTIWIASILCMPNT